MKAPSTSSAYSSIRDTLGASAYKVIKKADKGQIAFWGDISVIALANIFQLCEIATLSGKLEVQSTLNKGDFYFTKGILSYGMLQIHHRRLGEILLQSQLLTKEQLQECLQLHKQLRPQPRFGQLLIDKGYIDPKRLNNTLQQQVKEAFFETLSWQEGTFVFYQGLSPEPQEIQLRERVESLLLEGMVFLDNAAEIK